VSKKKWSLRGPGGDGGEGRSNRLLWIAGGIGIVVVSAAVAIGVVTALGGESLSEPDPEIPDVPALQGEEPAFERSSVADLLESTSFDDMSAEERESVKSEVLRVFSEAEFRASNVLVPAFEIVRRRGHTMAQRQYVITETPGDDYALTEIVTFFCDSEAAGFIDVYRSRKTAAGGVNTEGERQPAGVQGFELIAISTDWTDAKDLGLEDIDGHLTRGVEVQLTTSGGAVIGWQMWIDVETAQIRRVIDTTAPEAPYKFDWRPIPRIVPEPELGTPPCYNLVYGGE
jgi:hypothetical protein